MRHSRMPQDERGQGEATLDTCPQDVITFDIPPGIELDYQGQRLTPGRWVFDGGECRQLWHTIELIDVDIEE